MIKSHCAVVVAEYLVTSNIRGLGFESTHQHFIKSICLLFIDEKTKIKKRPGMSIVSKVISYLLFQAKKGKLIKKMLIIRY